MADLRFHKDMIIFDILSAHPMAAEVLERNGLPCHRCVVASSETLAEGCTPLAQDVDRILLELETLPERRSGPRAPKVRGLILFLMALFGLGSCGEDDSFSRFDATQAKTVVHQFLSSVVQRQDFDAAARACAAPFRFQGRVWEANVLRQNLEGQMKTLAPRLRLTEELEAFSHQDLIEGRWPRAEDLDESARLSEIKRLGVANDGFLVWARIPEERGVRFVVNPVRGALAIVGLLP